jgi:carboxylesterase type B
MKTCLKCRALLKFTLVLLILLLFVVTLAHDDDTTTHSIHYDDDDEQAWMKWVLDQVQRGGGNAPSQQKEEQQPHRPVVVQISNYGRVQGNREGGIDFFGGIPYAAPPVGNLRFAPPEPPTPWAPAKLDASHFGPDCWQLEDPLLNPGVSRELMSEDCLYLNIFTPAGQPHSRKLLPVMVWLHGGAFQQGGARRQEYNGRRLAERDIIVVTLNYRLGALGFMVSSSDGLYGNFGLMDQRAALDWISRNIRAFGGDPNSITLFGESAGAVMTGLHLMMEGAGTNLFHRAIMQSNPLGYTFRSVIIADFIGDALKRSVDCRDLACLRTERVEEIMRAQSSLMGVPRSVGDFFTWGPTLTQEVKVTFGGQMPSSSGGPLPIMSRSDEHRLFRNLDARSWQTDTDTARWSAVNVSQPMKGLHIIPDKIPILIGTNKHEGEMFVHSAFPAAMPKAVYWMFVGALFRDSASRVLKHYRGYVDEIEKEAEELAKQQMEEEENRMYYMEHREQLEREYETLLAMNATRKAAMNNRYQGGIEALVNTWSTGGAQDGNTNETSWRNRIWPFSNRPEDEEARLVRIAEKVRLREERKAAKKRARALKEAAKVVVDYRPVMSRIIDDYLFRCPSWHYAHLVSLDRERRGKYKNNVYVYRFSQPTHIPGYKECWGKSCHTAELPYVFQSMDVIRSNYSTLGPIAQKEAPAAPEYPYTDMLAAYRGALESFDHYFQEEEENAAADSKKDDSPIWANHTRAFNRILSHFFGDYFTEDADEELASDMAERWASFAKVSDPNYDGSKAEWLPWRYSVDVDMFQDWEDDVDDNVDPDNPWVTEGEYDYWSDIDDYSDDPDSEWTPEKEERMYRRRALASLGMEVVDEDVFRTELRRTALLSNDAVVDKKFLSSRFLFRTSLKWNTHDEGDKPTMSPRAMREAVLFAKEIGALGMGLAGDDRFPELGGESDFFPELFELRWPPEGRLIERDCTCDMWDKIRYRY